MSGSIKLSVAGLFLSVVLLSKWTSACNESVCGSVVSKCMLTRSCTCSLESCSCCKDCYSCLGQLYDQCCSCLDFCPKAPSNSSSLSTQSYVEDLADPSPRLFEALTAEPDVQDRWHSYFVPQSLKVSSSERSLFEINCTVAFMNECTSWSKCQQTCSSMGAAGLRWFHDGCCECLADTCINYGVNESRCLRCPSLIDDIHVEVTFDDYGQDMDTESDHHEVDEQEIGNETQMTFQTTQHTLKTEVPSTTQSEEYGTFTTTFLPELDATVDSRSLEDREGVEREETTTDVSFMETTTVITQELESS